MATYKGPAKTIVQCKLREAELHSMGYSRFMMQPPLSAHFTLINRKEDVGIEITLTPEEAHKLEQHLHEFRLQRELFAKPQQ